MADHKRLEAAEVPIFYLPGYEETASAIADAVEATARVVERQWNLAIPAGCEVHVLTDWQQFLDQTVPKSLRLLMRLTRPLWRARVERTFPLVGGWTLSWRGKPTVGVKPPELLAQSSPGLGDQLFVPVPDLLEKVRQVTCHELTHACTGHLRLPPWLHEGLAMRAVDHYVGYPTVLEASRTLAQADLSALDDRSYRRVSSGQYDALIRLYATGYWATRQLEEAQPAVLEELLQRRRPLREVTRRAQAALQLSMARAVAQ